MAWTWVLVAGTTTLNLNDGTNFHVNVGGFHAPPPRRLTSYSGGNLMRYGADLIEASWENRTVGMNLTMRGTTASNLGSNIGSLWNIMRMAEEWSKDGLGTQVQLRYQMEGQTGTYLFDIIEGSLDMGADLHGPYLLKGTRAQHAILTLECKPFVTQPGETLQNYIKDPNFEIAATPLADWAAFDDGGFSGSISTRTTAQSKFGSASLQIGFTSANGNLAFGRQSNSIAITSGDVWAIGAWSYRPTLNGTARAEFRVQEWNSGGTILKNTITLITSTNATFTLISTIITATASATTLSLMVGLRGMNATSTGTVFWDNVIVIKASSLPTAWVSGRDVSNHFDDNGQAHINYLDLYGVPGDVPAAIQIKVLENEAHTDLWVGARHDARMTGTGLFLEGENFTGTIGSWSSVSSANQSNGSYGKPLNDADMTSTAAGTPQVAMLNVAIPPIGQFRALAYARAGTSIGTIYGGLGFQYGGVTKDPSTTAHYKTIATTAFTLYDLGVITIPPTRTPEGGTIGTLGVRFAYYASTLTANLPYLDYIYLVPVDQGGAYVNKVSATDNLWIDSRSRPEGIYRVTTADVMQSYPPDQQGNPPLAHPKGSRFYFQSGSATGSIAHGFIVSVSYIPRFLFIGT